MTDLRLNLDYFMKESNWIENIQSVQPQDIEATEAFMALPELTVEAVCNFAKAVTQGYGLLRIHSGMDVMVGTHRPICGGPGVASSLKMVVRHATIWNPWKLHTEFECLHPFRDGNGRTGRVLWLWSMKWHGRPVYSSSFLRTFYYQTLEHYQNA